MLTKSENEINNEIQCYGLKYSAFFKLICKKDKNNLTSCIGLTCVKIMKIGEITRFEPFKKKFGC